MKIRLILAAVLYLWLVQSLGIKAYRFGQCINVMPGSVPECDEPKEITRGDALYQPIYGLTVDASASTTGMAVTAQALTGVTGSAIRVYSDGVTWKER